MMTILDIALILSNSSPDSSIFASLVTTGQRGRNLVIIFGGSMVLCLSCRIFLCK
uniref:Uncharacterized protein n=1 Tax=Octopus bimaculoides TaxID=37653 RepID=A0A0L8FHA5_OCTBM